MFSKNIKPMCMYCEYGRPLARKHIVLCKKAGPVGEDYNCGRFKYDPLKRIPAARPAMQKFDKGDFTL